jgi:integrase
MALYKQKNSQFWWCEFTVAGERVRQSTGESDREAAAKFETILKGKLTEAAPTKRRGVRHLRWLADEDIRAAAHTTERNQYVLKQRWKTVIAVVGDVDPESVTADTLKAYVEARRKSKNDGFHKTERKGVRWQTIKRELADIRRALERAKREGWVASLPEPWPKGKADPKKAAQAGKLHDEKTVRAVLREVSPNTADACRVAGATGLRWGELSRLRWSWVNQQKMPGVKVPAVLHLPDEGTKSRRERMVGLDAATLKILERRHKKYGDLLFPAGGFSWALRRACKRLKMATTVTLRDMRHIFATEALERTGDLAAVSKALGHASVATTALYLHADKVAAINLAARGYDDKRRADRKGEARTVSRKAS